MNAKALNQKATQEFENLSEHGYFQDIEIIEQCIKNNKNPFDTGFYLGQEDALNSIYGELQNSFGELSAELEKYLASRKLSIAIESSKNKGEFTVGSEKIKLTSTMLNHILSSLIRGEVDELYKVVLILESKIKRVISSLQTCRSHVYIKNQEVKRED